MDSRWVRLRRLPALPASQVASQIRKRTALAGVVVHHRTLSTKLSLALERDLSGKASATVVGAGMADDGRPGEFGIMPSATERGQSPDPSPLPCPAKPGSTADAGGLQLWAARG